uniref:PPPDE domain-containing protein n=1 Tax=Vannella robusta TaxID=1487602 RepID=A0A7S4HRD6_9EUKA
MQTERPIEVYLNVYDLVEHNRYVHSIGVGAYHTGVEIMGTEYSFGRLEIEGATGVFECPPKSVLPLRESILMGEIKTTPQHIADVIDSLKPEFLGTSYQVLTRNCNHFSDALCRQLLGQSIPAYVNRLSWLGTFVQCLLPPEFQSNVPEQIPVPPNRFPGNPSKLSEVPDANVKSKSLTEEDLTQRRERHARAAMKRLQQIQ